MTRRDKRKYNLDLNSSPKNDDIFFFSKFIQIFADHPGESSRDIWETDTRTANQWGWILGNYEILPVQIRDKSGPIIVGGQGGIEQLATRLVDWLLFNEADFIFHRRAAESIVKRPECFPEIHQIPRGLVAQ